MSFKVSKALVGFEKFQGRGTIIDAKTVVLKYGEGGMEAPAVQFTIKDGEGKEHIVEESAGSIKNWMPTLDGKNPAPEGTGFVAIGTEKEFRSNCNMMLMLTSIANAAVAHGCGDWDEKVPDDDISFFKGMEAEFEQMAAPVRLGLKKDIKEGQTARESTVTNVTKIYKLPWEGEKEKSKGKPGPKAKAGGESKTPPASGDVDEVGQEAQGYVFQVLSGQEGPIPKTKLASLVFGLMKEAKVEVKRMNQISGIVLGPASSDFYGADKPWKIDGGMVEIKEG